jgi:hypothetical protein
MEELPAFMIDIVNLQIHPRSKGTLAVQATISDSSTASGPLLLKGQVTALGTPLPWITATPVPVTLVPGDTVPVSITLRFIAPDLDAPLQLSSDGIDLQLAAPDGTTVAQTHVDYIRDWFRDLPDFRPAYLARLPYAPLPLDFETVCAAYDGDEGGSLVFAQTHGAIIGLVVGVETGASALEVLRWFDFGADPQDLAHGRLAQPGYRVPPGSYVDLAHGRVVADAAQADAIWERGSGAPPALRLRPLHGAGLATLQTPVMLPLAATRVFARGNPRDGTRRDWPEIRDLFDNCNEESYRTDFCVDNLWAPAAIEFRIVIRREIRIADNWAHELPVPALADFAHDYNLPGLLNVYFCRSVEGARAWGAPDRDLRLAGQQGALWVGDRCPDDHSTGCWTADVITVAHEAGHFLSLLHRCDDTQGHPCGPGEDTYLMYGDGTGPQSRRLTHEEIFRARQRAWLYRP